MNTPEEVEQWIRDQSFTSGKDHVRLVCLVDAVYALNRQRKILEGDKDESTRHDGVSHEQ